MTRSALGGFLVNYLKIKKGLELLQCYCKIKRFYKTWVFPYMLEYIIWKHIKKGLITAQKGTPLMLFP